MNTAQHPSIREANPSDADEISALICRAVRETNIRDYSRVSVERLASSFHPARVLEMIRDCTVFVAQIESCIAATAGLDGETVRLVFVVPDFQGRGLGRLLMHVIERTACERSIRTLRVPSSLTATGFYKRLGYSTVDDASAGDGMTVPMQKELGRGS